MTIKVKQHTNQTKETKQKRKDTWKQKMDNGYIYPYKNKHYEDFLTEDEIKIRKQKIKDTWKQKREEGYISPHKGKSLNHKPNCPCSFCRVKRKDYSWQTNEIKQNRKITWKQKIENGYIHPTIGKSLSKRGHKSNCKCTFCKNKRKDFSWVTEEVKKNIRKGMMKFKQDNPEKWKQKYIKVGKSSFESLIKKQPFIWDGVPFLSNAEKECAKLILKKPIHGINCNVYVNGKFIDFFPQSYDKQYQGMFVEFHPCWRKDETLEEYRKEREEIINNSNYKGTKLIVITDLKDITYRI